MTTVELANQHNPEALKQWAQQLQKQPLAQALVELGDFVNALNTQVADKVELFNTIELLRPFLHALNPLVTKEAYNEPTEADARDYIALLELEVAVYEHILEKPTELSETVLVTSLHRSLVNKIQDQVTHYQYYFLIPERKWLRIHRLFYVAIKNKVGSFGVNDNIYFADEKTSIVNLYCYLLLLSCARLSHFNARDILMVSNLLKQWCHLVKISQHPDAESKNQIMVDIATGAAPHFTKLFSPSELKIPCYLQIDELMQALVGLWMEKTEKEEAAKPDDELSADVLEYIKAAWSGYLYQEPLTKTHQEVEVCVGFNDVHFYLSGAKTLSQFLGEKSFLSVLYDEADDKAQIESGRMGDLWATFLSEPKGEPNFKKTPGEFNFQHHFKGVNEDEHNDDHPRYRVMMTEIGQHECSLMWETHSAPDLPLGQLVALRSQVNDHWQVGEIDSKIQINDEKTKIGIKIISTQAIPVGIDLPFGVGDNYCEAILTPPEDVVDGVTSFISVPRDFKSGDYVSVSQKDIEEKVQINKLMKKNEFFERCACAFLIKKRMGGTYRDELVEENQQPMHR